MKNANNISKENFRTATIIFKKLCAQGYEYEYKREIDALAKRGQKGKVKNLCQWLVSKAKQESFDMHARLIKAAEERLSKRFEEIFPFRVSKNINIFQVRFGKEVDITHTTQRNRKLYSSSYRFPGVDHIFTLYIKPGQKFIAQGSELIVYGKSGTTFTQDRGLNIKRKKTELNKIWVTVRDSVKAGNCEIGSEQFLKDVEKANSWGKVGALRADYLLELLDGKRVKRAIEYARTHKKFAIL